LAPLYPVLRFRFGFDWAVRASSCNGDRFVPGLAIIMHHEYRGHPAATGKVPSMTSNCSCDSGALGYTLVVQSLPWRSGGISFGIGSFSSAVSMGRECSEGEGLGFFANPFQYFAQLNPIAKWNICSIIEPTTCQFKGKAPKWLCQNLSCVIFEKQGWC
jgi:hypothetical protein